MPQLSCKGPLGVLVECQGVTLSTFVQWKPLISFNVLLLIQPHCLDVAKKKTSQVFIVRASV